MTYSRVDGTKKVGRYFSSSRHWYFVLCIFRDIQLTETEEEEEGGGEEEEGEADSVHLAEMDASGPARGPARGPACGPARSPRAAVMVDDGIPLLPSDETQMASTLFASQAKAKAEYVPGSFRHVSQPLFFRAFYTCSRIFIR